MSESLRDTIANAYEEVTAAETSSFPQPEGVVQSTIPAPVEPKASPEAPVEPDKPGRTAGRARDETGKLLPGKAVKPESVVEAAPAVARPPRPSSWKKDYWDHWEKLDPKLAEYINQRENEYARGVSTYKTEWDQVRPIAEAIQPFLPDLQQNNIKPEQWISNLGNAHKMLATGTPEAKASMFLKLAHDYQVPLESLFVQGQDGKLYFNPNVRPFQAQAAPQPQENIEERIKKVLLEQSTAQEIQSFATATDDKGQLKHPHFEAVRATMQGLLQAELATDINDAYNQAVRHPRHSDIAAQVQEQESRAEAERKAADQAASVARARKNAISPRSSTPSVAGETKPKGVRAAVEAAVEQHMGGGRV